MEMRHFTRGAIGPANTTRDAGDPPAILGCPQCKTFHVLDKCCLDKWPDLDVRLLLMVNLQLHLLRNIF